MLDSTGKIETAVKPAEPVSQDKTNDNENGAAAALIDLVSTSRSNSCRVQIDHPSCAQAVLDSTGKIETAVKPAEPVSQDKETGNENGAAAALIDLVNISRSC